MEAAKEKNELMTNAHPLLPEPENEVVQIRENTDFNTQIIEE